MTRADISAIFIMLGLCTVVIAVTFAGILFGDWFAGVVYRSGAHGNAASWIAHLTGLMLVVVVTLSAVARAATGAWWFRQ